VKFKIICAGNPVRRDNASGWKVVIDLVAVIVSEEGAVHVVHVLGAVEVIVVPTKSLAATLSLPASSATTASRI
jgi:Ni,Fe-hydrogenase maturation factor